MMPHHLIAFVLASLAAEDAGVIEGVVLNGTLDSAPMAGVEVVLRAGEEGFFVPVAQTVTDEQGRFVFSNAPVEPGLVYLPGANRHGVHYPGPRIQLRPGATSARVRLTAFDAVTSPNPLIAEQHEIDIQLQAGVLQVTETLLVKNPTRRAFVGEARGETPPVTLSLAIPAGYERVSFFEEFHGRRFQVADGHLVTDIPWPPGERKLKFTYRLPVTERKMIFARALDVPCSRVRVCVRDEDVGQVECNLPRATSPEERTIVFDSTDQPLPAGHPIELQMGGLPTPWITYGRWTAVALLAGLMAGTICLWGRR